MEITRLMNVFIGNSPKIRKYRKERKKDALFRLKLLVIYNSDLYSITGYTILYSTSNNSAANYLNYPSLMSARFYLLCKIEIIYY